MAIKLYIYDKDNKEITQQEARWCWVPEDEDGVLYIQDFERAKDKILIALETDSGLKILVKEGE